MGWLFAKLYDRITHGAERAGLADWRRELLDEAHGEVLESGAGTGANLESYPEAVQRLILVEPDRHMRARLAERLTAQRPWAEVLDAPAEALPFADQSIDTVVFTLVLCSVRDPLRALAEARRVLRPDGRLLYLEHVAHTDARIQRWQRRLEPFWRRYAANCHLTRPTAEWLRAAGFSIQHELEQDLPLAPSFVRRSLRGCARPI